MKKFFVGILTVLTLIAVSCGPTNPPVNPTDGGTYLIEEVYSLVGMELDKATAQLENRGYVQGRFTSPEDGIYQYSYTSNDVKFDIYMYEEEGKIMIVDGETSIDLDAFILWGPWVTNKLNYNMWMGYLNDDLYTDGSYFDVIKAEIIAEFEETNGKYLQSGFLTQEQYDNLLAGTLARELGGSKEEYMSALNGISYSKNLYIEEVYAQFNKNYNGMVVELVLDAEEKSMYCYAMKGDLSDYFDFENYVEIEPKFAPITRKLLHAK